MRYAPEQNAPAGGGSEHVCERLAKRRQAGRVAAFAILGVALIALASPPLALLAGVGFGVTLGQPFPKAGARITKRLLQACVVLLGFGMDFPTIVRTGLHGWLFASVTISATLLAGYWVGKKLGVHARTSTLVSAGTAICGGSAIAAVSSVLEVTQGQIAVSMGTVFLLNAAALYVFPLLGHVLHLGQHQFGVWAGVAIHDISSVVGAAIGYGREALETATAVKLSRTLWIVPLVLGIALATRRRTAEAGAAAAADTAGEKKFKAEFPWFIGLFLLASLTRTLVPGVAQASTAISAVARSGLTLVLLLIGASLTIEGLRAVGWRAPLQGALLWVFISVVSLLAILYGVA